MAAINVSFTPDEFERVVVAVQNAKRQYEDQAADHPGQHGVYFQDHADALGDILVKLAPLMPPEEDWNHYPEENEWYSE